MFYIKLLLVVSNLFLILPIIKTSLEVEINFTVSKEPRIVVPAERLNHDEGTNATFTCSIGSGDLSGLTFEWRKDDIIVNAAANMNKMRLKVDPENYQSALRVFDLHAADAGVYSCTAKNKYGQDKVSTKLNVKVQMKWVEKPTDLEVGAGKSINIPCKAEGSHVPTIEWFKIDEEVRMLGSELRLTSANQQDSGYYECRAKNGHDEELVSRMRLSVLVNTFYNITPVEDKIIKLDGYDDKNYLITDISDNRRYVLKIIDERSSSDTLTDIIDQVSGEAHEFEGKELRIPQLIKTSTGRRSARKVSILHRRLADGETTLLSCSVKLFEYFDGIMIKELLSSKRPLELQVPVEKIYPRLGHLCAELTAYLKTKSQFTEELSSIRSGKFVWQLIDADQVIEKLADRLYPDASNQRRILIDKNLKQFRIIKEKLNALPQFILHGDLSMQNILIRENDGKLCVVDFQDLQVGPQIVELAILMLYALLEYKQDDFKTALRLYPAYVLQSYQKNSDRPIPYEELLYIPILMRLRLCQSLLNGLIAAQANPGNIYVLETNKNGWQMLEALSREEDNGSSGSQKLVDNWQSCAI